MACLFFTSDTHFSHTNTWAKYKDLDGSPLRPFTSTPEMDELMIARWNETVRPQDHIYHLGDVSMMRPRLIRGILARLNGHKRLVRGNHDIFHTREYMEHGFEEIYGVRVLENLIFTHIPIHARSMGRFAANVHGHIHTGPDLTPALGLAQNNTVLMMPYINITVEHTLYRPLSLEEIKGCVKTAVERGRV